MILTSSLFDVVVSTSFREFISELRSKGALLKHGRVFVLDDPIIKEAILEETHSSAYAMHPRSSRMYQTLREHY